MIRDLKLGFRVMKYGLNADYSVFSVFLSIVAGLFFEFLLPTGVMGGLMFGMGAVVVVQLIFSVSVSTMVQTSPHKKRLQTIIPAMCGGILLIVANTASLILAWLGYLRVQNNENNPFFYMTMEPGELEARMIVASGLMVFTMLYTVLAMKHFWLGTFLFVIVFIGGSQYVKAVGITYLIMPTGLAVLLSYVIIIVGCGLMYLISCVTYKRDYSKSTFQRLLKRAS